MPLPTRPVSLAAIASEWGQQVHDYTFAPAGVLVSGGALAAPAANAWGTLPIDTAVDDPGGYADTANNRLEIPAEGAGLYFCRVRVSSDDGDADDRSQIRLTINGTEVYRNTETQEGGDIITLYIGATIDVTVGDLVRVQARQVGSGTRAEFVLTGLELIRLGFERGAPS
jgi:hypothetical protein